MTVLVVRPLASVSTLAMISVDEALSTVYAVLDISKSMSAGASSKPVPVILTVYSPVPSSNMTVGAYVMTGRVSPATNVYLQ